MWNRNQSHIENEKLDRFGEELLHALEAHEAEINTAATSPFLYRRIQVRIAAEEKRRAESKGALFTLLAEARHAIPILAMIAVIAIGLVWYGPAQTPQHLIMTPSSQTNVNPVLLTISNDEMVASFVGWSESGSNQTKEQ